MFSPQKTSTTMELLPLVSLCLLTCSATTSADEKGPEVIIVAVEEGSDAILPCALSTKKNIEKMVFDWKKDGLEVFLYDKGNHYNKGRAGQDEQFKKRVFHFEEELKNGNASIKVQKTKMADSGNYTCTFPNEQISHIKLAVGAAPEPSVILLDGTNDWVLLQCKVQGAFPQPKLQWQDSAGNILPAGEPQVSERGGRYDIILKTNVTKTDIYRCVATQEDINHQIYTETYVPVSGSSTGLVVAVSVLGALVAAGVVGGVVSLAWCYRRRRSTQNSQKGSPQESVPLKEGSQTSRPQPSGQPPDPET